MIQVAVGNSFSRITGLTAQQEKLLRKELSYVENRDSAFFSGGLLHRRCLLSKRGDFPTGLLARVVAFFEESITLITRPSAPLSPESAALRPGIMPWPSQEAAAKRAASSGRGTISMPTGTGKSLVAALIAARINLKTLIIVPTLEIKRQFTEDLARYLIDPSFITVTNIDDSRLTQMTNFDCLIIDEAHHIAARTYQRLNKVAWSKIYYRFFLTATPFRNQKDEQLLFEALAGQVIYRLTYKEAIKAGYIVPVEAYYIELPKQKTDAYYWKEVYSELVVNNKTRNDKIAELLNKLYDSGLSTLCLVREVQHGEILSRLTWAPFVHGSSEDRQAIQRFNSKEFVGLIGTTGVLGEGVDTKPCEYVIIAGLGKAKSSFMQQVGRAVRKYPGKESAKVILIQDRTHKFTSRHFAAQCRILKEEYGIVPIKLEDV